MSRADKVAQALKREISNIIHGELKDPRIGFVTVIRIELSRDLTYAKVFFSVLGSEKEQKTTVKALESAGGFIRRLIAARIRLRQAPEFRFIQDKSSEYGIQIQQALDRINNLPKRPKK